MSKTRGLINRIIPFSSVDGPGNRMVIFLQGCNLDCINCHNPHTIGICNYCGKCIDECPVQAIKLVEGDSKIDFDEASCQNCDKCLEVCPVNSNPRSRWSGVEELLDELRAAAPFLSGITISGGEATQQLDFVRELFARIKDDDQLSQLTTFIDSNGLLKIEDWKSILPFLDGAMIDLKAVDDLVHRKITGSSNKLVLETLSFLYRMGKLYEVRLLIIPELNDQPGQITRTANYLAEIGKDLRIRLIPFRSHGVREEYNYLNSPSEEKMIEIKDFFEEKGFKEVVVT